MEGGITNVEMIHSLICLRTSLQTKESFRSIRETRSRDKKRRDNHQGGAAELDGFDGVVEQEFEAVNQLGGLESRYVPFSRFTTIPISTLFRPLTLCIFYAEQLSHSNVFRSMPVSRSCASIFSPLASR
jgi:hypothetical protein